MRYIAGPNDFVGAHRHLLAAMFVIIAPQGQFVELRLIRGR